MKNRKEIKIKSISKKEKKSVDMTEENTQAKEKKNVRFEMMFTP